MARYSANSSSCWAASGVQVPARELLALFALEGLQDVRDVLKLEAGLLGDLRVRLVPQGQVKDASAPGPDGDLALAKPRVLGGLDERGLGGVPDGRNETAPFAPGYGLLFCLFLSHLPSSNF